MTELNVTPGHKEKTSWLIVFDSIVRENLHRFSFTIVSETGDIFKFED